MYIVYITYVFPRRLLDPFNIVYTQIKDFLDRQYIRNWIDLNVSKAFSRAKVRYVGQYRRNNSMLIVMMKFLSTIAASPPHYLLLLRILLTRLSGRIFLGTFRGFLTFDFPGFISRNKMFNYKIGCL